MLLSACINRARHPTLSEHSKLSDVWVALRSPRVQSKCLGRGQNVFERQNTTIFVFNGAGRGTIVNLRNAVHSRFHARLPHHYAHYDQTHDLGNATHVVIIDSELRARPCQVYKCGPNINFLRCIVRRSFSLIHPMHKLLASALVGFSFASCAFSFTPGFPYGSQKVRGVNLGGWLVLEVCTQMSLQVFLQ